MDAAAGGRDAGCGLRVGEFGKCLAAGSRHADEQRLGAKPHDPHGMLATERTSKTSGGRTLARRLLNAVAAASTAKAAAIAPSSFQSESWPDRAAAPVRPVARSAAAALPWELSGSAGSTCGTPAPIVGCRAGATEDGKAVCNETVCGRSLGDCASDRNASGSGATAAVASRPAARTGAPQAHTARIKAAARPIPKRLEDCPGRAPLAAASVAWVSPAPDQSIRGCCRPCRDTRPTSEGSRRPPAHQRNPASRPTQMLVAASHT